MIWPFLTCAPSGASDSTWPQVCGGNLRFVADAEANRLTVPLEAVSLGTPAVEVLEGDRLVRRSVTLGAANEREVVVMAGLKPGDRVAERYRP